MDGDGYVFAIARTDDIINVAGHRLSNRAIEEVLARHPGIAECAVVGVADDLKGQLPVGFFVLNDGVERPLDEIEHELARSVRHQIGAVAEFKQAVNVARLPKTRSGKVLRGTIKKIAVGVSNKVPAAIDDVGVLDEIAQVLEDFRSG